MLAKQIDTGRNFRRAPLASPQPQLLPKHHQMDLDFNAGEEFADALARTGTERTQGQLGSL